MSGYNQAVDDAEIAFERLGRDTALATFLRIGAATDNEPVRIACREIAAIVALSLTPRSDERAAGRPASHVERAS